MTEPILKKISDDACRDEVRSTFDRLLRQYFLAEYPESRSHTVSEQAVGSTADVSVE